MRNAALHVEQAIDRDFIALLVAKNRAGASVPIPDLLRAHAIAQTEYDACCADPTFEATVTKYAKQLNEEGFGVEQKAAVLHEMGLPIVFDILRDPEQPAMARLKAHEMLGDVSGQSKAKKLQQLTAHASGYQLIINLPGATPALPQTETFHGLTIENPENEVRTLLMGSEGIVMDDQEADEADAYL
jgi:hypothetical protein